MIKRILDKLDGFLAKNDYNSAETHLLYWLDEVTKNKDGKTRLLICNELMGLYRKLGKKENSIKFAKEALLEIEKMQISQNIGAATTYINCATVYKAFGMAKEAMPLFYKAKEIYEQGLDPLDERLAGLYNNMALALVDLKNFTKATEYNQKALLVIEAQPTAKPEAAVTYLNMATAIEQEIGLIDGEQKINEYLQKAMEILDKTNAINGNYAFVCEKCAGVFGYYGFFHYENELKSRARNIYERP